MDLNFLGKKGTKNLKNVLLYLKNPKLIEHSSQRTLLSKKGNREEIIISSLKYLNNEEKELLITYIRNREDVVREFIDAFQEFKEVDKKEDIQKFLYDLMKKIDNKKIKIEIFRTIFQNDEQYSLKIIYETEPENLKR